MDARVLIETLQSRGLSVSLARDKIRVEAPQEPDGDTKAILQELREHREEVKSFLNEEDPTLMPNQWYPDFRDFHHKVIAETPDFDYLWLKTHKPDLYQTIRAKENALDDLRDTRLSEIMAIMREWRGLILQAEMEATKTTGVVPEGPKG